MNPIRCWCPDCGDWLWDSDEREYLNVCPRCRRHITVDDVKLEIEWYPARIDN